ncbi:fliO protein [Asticcacaulis biprosthecium C19]|uniref:FliO protein n=1 Tax=Asticcacaulis biprosthecium C19 TaxID=715226 RepID=F4QPB2_9CAUL|nr:flagellar biosynthetic protein FliO [Asticcacaulis biprosthecium]EGF91170.1 fliO protein [Asticcacaulis biprosthecium C19]
MDFLNILKAVFALSIVLGLILGLAYVLRRYAPQVMARLQAQRGERRLKVVETLVLDPARRLVLVRLDDEERLILLGEGRELIEPRLKPAPRPAPTAAATKPASPPVSQDDDLF